MHGVKMHYNCGLLSKLELYIKHLLRFCLALFSIYRWRCTASLSFGTNFLCTYLARFSHVHLAICTFGTIFLFAGGNVLFSYAHIWHYFLMYMWHYFLVYRWRCAQNSEPSERAGHNKRRVPTNVYKIGL